MITDERIVELKIPFGDLPICDEIIDFARALLAEVSPKPTADLKRLYDKHCRKGPAGSTYYCYMDFSGFVKAANELNNKFIDGSGYGDG